MLRGAREVHPRRDGRGPASALMSAPAIGNSNTSDPHTATVDVFIRSSRRGHRVQLATEPEHPG